MLTHIKIYKLDVLNNSVKNISYDTIMIYYIVFFKNCVDTLQCKNV